MVWARSSCKGTFINSWIEWLSKWMYMCLVHTIPFRRRVFSFFVFAGSQVQTVLRHILFGYSDCSPVCEWKVLYSFSYLQTFSKDAAIDLCVKVLTFAKCQVSMVKLMIGSFSRLIGECRTARIWLAGNLFLLNMTTPHMYVLRQASPKRFLAICCLLQCPCCAWPRPLPALAKGCKHTACRSSPALFVECISACIQAQRCSKKWTQFHQLFQTLHTCGSTPFSLLVSAVGSFLNTVPGAGKFL